MDPYPHYWSYRCISESSDRPLTLGELIELIDTAELVGNSSDEAESRGLVFGVLEQNLDGSVDELRSFIRVSSAFYDDLEVWYALACSEWCREHSWEEEEEEEEVEEEEVTT